MKVLRSKNDSDTTTTTKSSIKSIPSEDLVPGDIIYLEESNISACDMAILEGECLVNEALLTGESIPCSKIALATTSNGRGMEEEVEGELYSSVGNDNSTIFAGCEVLKVSANAKALVTRVGFQTRKGGMVRDILYPSL